MNNKKYQVIIVKFSNGKEGIFMGKAIITKEEVEKGVQALLPIQITEPKDLPEGVNFGSLDE